MRLKNKVIIVTGSCTGIGKAIAMRTHAEGAQVIVHGLDKKQGESLLDELGIERSALLLGDLTDEGFPERLVQFAIQRFGRLDAVVNNAALIAGGNIRNVDAVRFREFLEINTIVPYLLIRAALPYLESTQGCVLNIGSVNAYSGEPDLMPYSVSKGALMTLTRNLGDSLMREFGVRVNQINPGWVLTEAERKRKRAEGFVDDWQAKLPIEFAPAGRILKPEELAAAAIYWLSDEAGPISGQVVEIEQYPFIGRNPPKDQMIRPG